MDQPSATGRTEADICGPSALGWITQPTCGGWFTPTFNVFERENDAWSPFAKMEGQCCFGGVASLCCENKLQVSKMTEESINSGIKVGDMAVLKKKRPKSLEGAAAMAFTDQADVFTLEFENPDQLTAKQKALLVATVFTSDYMLFGELVLLLRFFF